MITGWTSLLTGVHAQGWWAASLQIPGSSFKILYLLKFLFFLLNFPPWTANNLSHHACVYSFNFFIFAAALHLFWALFLTISPFPWQPEPRIWLGCVRAVPLITESWILQRGGIQTPPHHSSFWSVWPFLGPVNEELWRFSWVGLGLLEDIC